MKVLITGASGFVGAHLAKYLNECGYEVHILLRTFKNLPSFLRESDQVKKHIIQINLHEVRKICEEVKPDVVLHLASLFLSSHNPDDIDGLMELFIKIQIIWILH